MSEFLLIIHEALCGALFYTCFCRAVHTSEKNTRVGIRLVIWLLGMASCMGIAWPIYRNWHPDEFSIFLLFAVTVGQMIFAGLWSQGVPAAYQKEPTCER